MIDLAIDTRTTRLSPVLLARFGGGLRWYQIVTKTHGTVAEWWRDVVMRAEDDGLLIWDRVAKVWNLTDTGRELVRASAKGAA